MRTLIREVRVFDGEQEHPPADVIIDGDRIAAPDGSPVEIVVDGSGRTLLPGLIDAHTHVFEGSLAQALTYGVTTELDMFCLPGNLVRQRRLAASDDTVADLRSAGTLATAPGGHPSQLLAGMDEAAREAFGDAAGVFETVADPSQAAEFVEARLAERSDYLKIVIDDGALYGGDSLPAMDARTVAALIEAARARGLTTIAHALTAAEVAIALDGGIDGLAHVYADAEPDGPLGSDLVHRIAAQGVFVVSTLVYFEVIAGQAEAATHAHPGTFDNALHAARTLHQAGVPLLAGTDANPYAPAHGVALHRELALLCQAGLSNEEALAAATSVPARHFGLADRGRIGPGFRADLVLVDGDPIRDIAATTAIAEVWRGGVRQPR